MADPFEALHAPVPSTDPDSSFAARLRARLERALDLPRGATVSGLTTDVETAPATATGVVPYLAVADARRALEWYVEAFGAHRRGEPVVMPDGRIGHAELEVAGGLVMLSAAHPEIGMVAPEPGQGATVTLHASVADVDASPSGRLGQERRSSTPPPPIPTVATPSSATRSATAG